MWFIFFFCCTITCVHICLCNRRWFRSSWVYILMKNKFTCAANLGLWNICFFFIFFFQISTFFFCRFCESVTRIKIFLGAVRDKNFHKWWNQSNCTTEAWLRKQAFKISFAILWIFMGEKKNLFEKFNLPMLRQRALGDLTQLWAFFNHCSTCILMCDYIRAKFYICEPGFPFVSIKGKNDMFLL